MLKNFIFILNHLFVICYAFPQNKVSYSSDKNGNINEPLILSEIVTSVKNLASALFFPPDANKINFMLYTQNKNWEVIATGNSLKIKNSSGLKSGKPYKILIHGFLQNCNGTEFAEPIVKAYSESKPSEYNLICVDWGPLAHPGTITQVASLLHYPKAANNTLIVGDATERFIESLISNGHLKNQSVIDVHLIGHSLGGHASGVCGHEFYVRNKNKISRITALDPAGPKFFDIGDEDKSKLSKSDAKLVDVIYVNMGGLGIDEFLGHVNYIPNGGKVQPFCEKENLLEDLAETFSGVCSHSSAIGMFAKSIKENIKACKCSSWKAFTKTDKECKKSEMISFGDKVSNKARGQFCLVMKSL